MQLSCYIIMETIYILLLIHDREYYSEIKKLYFNAIIWGFAPNPTHFFALMQKSKQKKSSLRPLRSKNCRSKG